MICVARRIIQHWIIIIVDNDSKRNSTLEYFSAVTREDERVKILYFPGEFNYSALNNFAVEHALGELIALLNNDISVKHADWLREMVSYAVRDGVGAVGAKLYYPNGKLQHVGVAIGTGGIAGHVFCGRPANELGYFANAVLTRQVSAVTAAYLVISKKFF